ncbi:DUF104 domain-containing protein [bacterium]|nr:DUF104 domain-containing protein [bacterium]
MTFSAVYSNGVFLPDGEVQLPEGTKVEVTPISAPVPTPDEVIAILSQRYPGTIGLISGREADKLRHDIEEECERIDVVGDQGSL